MSFTHVLFRIRSSRGTDDFAVVRYESKPAKEDILNDLEEWASKFGAMQVSDNFVRVWSRTIKLEPKKQLEETVRKLTEQRNKISDQMAEVDQKIESLRKSQSITDANRASIRKLMDKHIAAGRRLTKLAKKIRLAQFKLNPLREGTLVPVNAVDRYTEDEVLEIISRGICSGRFEQLYPTELTASENREAIREVFFPKKSK